MLIDCTPIPDHPNFWSPQFLINPCSLTAPQSLITPPNPWSPQLLITPIPDHPMLIDCTPIPDHPTQSLITPTYDHPNSWSPHAHWLHHSHTRAMCQFLWILHLQMHIRQHTPSSGCMPYPPLLPKDPVPPNAQLQKLEAGHSCKLHSRHFNSTDGRLTKTVIKREGRSKPGKASRNLHKLGHSRFSGFLPYLLQEVVSFCLRSCHDTDGPHSISGTSL